MLMSSIVALKFTSDSELLLLRDAFTVIRSYFTALDIDQLLCLEFKVLSSMRWHLPMDPHTDLYQIHAQVPGAATSALRGRATSMVSPNALVLTLDDRSSRRRSSTWRMRTPRPI